MKVLHGWQAFDDALPTWTNLQGGIWTLTDGSHTANCVRKLLGIRTGAFQEVAGSAVWHG